MLIAREYQIERAISQDETRLHIHSALLDTAKRRVVATDGHMMAVVPVELEDGDTSGLIPRDAFAAARKATPKTFPNAMIGANGKIVAGLPGLPHVEYPRDTETKFPPYEQVLPSVTPDHVTFGFSPRLLLELCKALGGKEVVSLTIDPKDPLAPMIVNHGQEAFGVLMPARV